MKRRPATEQRKLETVQEQALEGKTDEIAQPSDADARQPKQSQQVSKPLQSPAASMEEDR